MNKINVLYLTATLDVGGSEWIAYLLAKGLNRERYNPIVGYYFWSGKLEDLLRSKGIEVVNLGPGKDKIASWDRYRSILKISKFLRGKEIKIVHTFQFDVDVLGAIASRLAGVPVIISHIQGESFLKNFRDHQWRYKFVSKFLVHKYIACSKYLAKGFASNCIKDEIKIVTIQNCVDEEKFDFLYRNDGNNLRKELGLSNGEIVIGCIANFASCKGHRYLIDAISKVKFSFPKVKLLLVGKFTPLKEDLVKQAKSLGVLDSIIFLDFHLNIAEILNSVDIFVLPSLEEGLPLSILEAMYMGKPIIATKIGGVPEAVIDGETGILVPPKDSESLAKAMLLLLTSKDKAQEMGRRGKERCLKEFSSNVFIREIEDLYESLLNEKGIKP